MKKLVALFLLLSGFYLQPVLYGQGAIQINGIVKSQQGPIQGAQVQFLNLNNEFQGNCISGPNGMFTSEKKMAIGNRIRVKIIAPGYKIFEKDISIDKTGDAGEFMIQRASLVIAGFVRDSITEMALPGTEIFFFDEQGRLIQAKSTNSMGYFDMETNFVYGQKITVRAAKKGYYDDKEQTLTFTSEGKNTLPDIMLPEQGTRGLRAFIRVKDRRNGSPLGGGTVRYFDKRKSTYVDAQVPNNGELELKLYQRPGTSLDVEINKTKYRTFQLKAILSEDPLNNVFTCALEKGS